MLNAAYVKGFDVGLSKFAADLTVDAREHIKKKNFAMPGERKYPIEDPSHARNALARVSQFGSAGEQAQVRSKVKAKYPGIEVGGEKKAFNVPPEFMGMLKSPMAKSMGRWGALGAGAGALRGAIMPEEGEDRLHSALHGGLRGAGGGAVGALAMPGIMELVMSGMMPPSAAGIPSAKTSAVAPMPGRLQQMLGRGPSSSDWLHNRLMPITTRQSAEMPMAEMLQKRLSPVGGPATSGGATDWLRQRLRGGAGEAPSFRQSLNETQLKASRPDMSSFQSLIQNPAMR